MPHEVPIGVTEANGFIGNANTSQLIFWVNIAATTTPANVTLFSFEGGTTAGNTIAVIDTGIQGSSTVTEHFVPNLLAQDGCFALTSSNVSIANVGYRSYSG